MKAPRLITHYKRFNNARREATDFYQLVSKGLQEKLGTVLFQLHPGIAYSEENLQRIIDTLDPAFENVLEFRHESWWNDDVLRKLADERVTFCGISYPGLPDGVFRTSPVVYYRFHGVPQLYLSSYSDTELKGVARSISKFTDVSDVYAYFNNDIEVAAVFNARKLMEIADANAILLRNTIAPSNLQ